MLERIKMYFQKFFSVTFLKFVAVGVVNTGIDFCVFNTILFILVLDTFEKELIIAKIGGFLIASGNSYFLNAVWTFRSSTKNTHKSYVTFMCVSVIGICVNVSVAYGVFLWGSYVLKMHPVLIANMALICAVCASLLWNYFGYKKFVFKS